MEEIFMSKKFFSFLGRGSFNKETNTYGYSPCVYSFNSRNSKKTEFVQDAIAQVVLPEFSSDDRICIFVTPTVRKENWVKLEPILKSMYGDIVKPVFINDFKNKEDIWDLFKSLYEHIEDGDDIYLDITHSFRYLPMLYLTVLDYAQYLKNITVSGIFYGAFEAQYEENSEKIAPIFDLTDMFETMQWANAADSFVNYGTADKLYKQIKKQDMEFSDTGKLSDSILKLANNMNYARGQRIYEGKMFSNCLEKINTYKYSADVKLNPILLPILDSVEKKMKDFKTNSALNFIPAVQWYIDHDMPAEAISMLKEGICTYLITEANGDFKNSYLRLTLGSRLANKSNNPFRYNPNQMQWKDSVEAILSTELAKRIKPIIEDFNDFRNDIDHSGFAEQARRPENLRKEIIGAFNSVLAVFKEEGILE